MNKKSVKIIIVCIAVAALVAVCAVFGVKIKNDINGNEKGSPKEYTLVIESKDFQYEISKMLANNGIVVDDSIWSAWMDKHYPDFTYINGEYYMKSNMSYEEIAQKLQNPDISHKVVPLQFLRDIMFLKLQKPLRTIKFAPQRIFTLPFQQPMVMIMIGLPIFRQTGLISALF